MLAWAEFGDRRYVFKGDIIITLKRRIFDQCFLPALTYAAETLSMIQKTAAKLTVAQRRMNRSML